ncbi:hypothetical protein TeGR_g3043 [Tetraparma gracilis]|uniref:Uncharacterized protein n=1 Tax=Tetraparma gracilis TaxID=2962635 RepID=A0ABQ6NCE3_9STRA|nr:hypothetical protein TeGR_g3043 [Tetraparma gracilis]
MEHDGVTRNQFWDMGDATSATLAPGAARAAPLAFGDCGGVASFAGFGGAPRCGTICHGAFMGCPLAAISLAPPCPPRVKIGPCAFALCGSLPDLRFLPFSADVSELAFGARRARQRGHAGPGCSRSRRRRSASSPSARGRGTRRLVPARRYAVYSCVAAARGQEGRRRGRVGGRAAARAHRGAAE